MTTKELERLELLIMGEMDNTLTDVEITELESLREKQASENVDQSNNNDEPIKSTSNKIITDLEETNLKVKIHKVAKMENEATKEAYYMLSCFEVDKQKGINLSISEKMLQQFGYDEIIKEGIYIAEGKQPIYQNLLAVYVPNDGKRYGYVDKKRGTTEEYRIKGNWLIRQFHGSVSQDYIKAVEMGDFSINDVEKKAQNLFKIVTGRNYVANVSQEDTDRFMTIYTSLAK